MVEKIVKKPMLFSFLVGTGAMLVCLIMIWITVPLFGETYQPSMFINGVLGSYGIGSPVAYFCSRQAERLRIANSELMRVQEALSDAHDALSHKVRLDQMTGFLNREYFFEAYHAHHEPDSNEDTNNTLLIIDADHFKKINDTYGHLAGDAALSLITKAITSALRAEDVIGRIGGEEFGLLLTGTNHDEALIVAERIRKRVEELEFKPNGTNETVKLTVSIGGVHTGRVADLSSAMGAADRNLYSAKNTGRNRVIIEPGLKIAA
jgi:diguanylate cyclase (GGDEF)-like protein